MRLVECFLDQVLKQSKVLCASNYGHNIARTEFWSQCHILLLSKPKYIESQRAQGDGPRAKWLKGLAQGPKGSMHRPKGQRAQGPAQGPRAQGAGPRANETSTLKSLPGEECVLDVAREYIKRPI